jgi:uncharacterized Zn-finger protein
MQSLIEVLFAPKNMTKLQKISREPKWTRQVKSENDNESVSSGETDTSKKHECKVCGKRFQWRSNLSQHLDGIHSKLKKT